MLDVADAGAGLEVVREAQRQDLSAVGPHRELAEVILVEVALGADGREVGRLDLASLVGGNVNLLSLWRGLDSGVFAGLFHVTQNRIVLRQLFIALEGRNSGCPFYARRLELPLRLLFGVGLVDVVFVVDAVHASERVVGPLVDVVDVRQAIILRQDFVF